MDSMYTGAYHRPASHITIVAHVFGLTSIVLLLVWLLHYREGLDLYSTNPARIFNVHPFLMFFGFIFVAGEGLMAYKTVGAERQVKKFVHMGLNLIALCLGIIGIHAAFKFHDSVNLKDMYSLHSWIGIGTFCLYILQWLFGFAVFMFPGGTLESRRRAAPWHVCGGRALLYMAICTAETGLMQKYTSLNLDGEDSESRLINFLAVAILLFGIFVDLSLALARYV